MKQIILNNAHYWLRQIHALPPHQAPSAQRLRNAVLALEALHTLPEEWKLAHELTVYLHELMELSGNWRDWEYYLRWALAQARGHADLVAEAGVLLNLGALKRRQGEALEAIQAYLRAWRLMRGAGNLEEAVALSNLSDLYLQQGAQERVEVLSKRALQIFESLRYKMHQAQTLNHLATFYLEQQRWELALDQLEQARSLAEQINDVYCQALILQNFSLLHHRQQQWDAAEAYLYQAHAKYQQLNDQDHLAQLQLNLGSIHLRRGDLQQAEAAYRRAEMMFKSLGNRLNLAHVRHNLGMIYTRLEYWEEAERCFTEAYVYWRALGHLWHAANTLDDWAALYLAWPQHQARAIDCLEQAWPLIRTQQDSRYHRLQNSITRKRTQLGLSST